MNESLKVFVSYSRKQKAEVEAFAADLTDLGHAPWLDEELEGAQTWWSEILRRIRDCDLFVFAFSHDSDTSKACKSELKYASELNKRILPIKVAEISDTLLPEETFQLQLLDYRTADKQAYKALERSLRDLPATRELPDELPDEPPVPLSYISSLKMEIDASDFSPDGQRLLVSKLEERTDNPEEAEDVLKLAYRLKRKSDVLASVEKRLDVLIGKLERSPSKPAKRPERARQPVHALPTTPPAKKAKSSEDTLGNVFKWIGIIVVGLILLGMCQGGF